MAEPSPEQIPPLDPALRKTPATMGAVYEMIMTALGEVGKSITERLGKQQSKTVAEIVALRQRIKQLEANALTDGGIWSGEKLYRPGAVTTHAGVPWVAQQETNERPGTSSAWRLMAKSHK